MLIILIVICGSINSYTEHISSCFKNDRENPDPPTSGRYRVGPTRPRSKQGDKVRQSNVVGRKTKQIYTAQSSHRTHCCGEMSISAIFGAAVPNRCSTAASFGARKAAPRLGGGAAVIECSSRPQKKGTSHHMKTRPRKTQPWDIKRRPTVYAPLPPLPPEWTVVSSDADASDAAVPPGPPPTPQLATE